MSKMFVPNAWPRLALAAVLLAAGCQEPALEGRQAEHDAGAARREPAASSLPASQPDKTRAEPMSSQESNASLDATGVLRIELAGYALALQASGCTPSTDTLTLCNDEVELKVSGPEIEGEQSLELPSIYVNSAHTLYRGSLTQGYQEQGYTFVLADIDGDGKDDLMVWTGKEGGYGGASCDVYLFDPSQKRFVHSQSLSDLTIGAAAPFSIENGFIKLSSTDGNGLIVSDSYRLQGGEPELVERMTEERGADGQAPKVRIERMIDGELKEVKGAAEGQ